MVGVSDLEFFVRIVAAGSLSALARELGVTPPAVSTRLARLEGRLGARLLTRTTRSLHLTHEGQLYLDEGRELLAVMQALEERVGGGTQVARGLLRVNATMGFGRRFVAPAVSAFCERYPGVQVHLELTDRLLSLTDGQVDVGIRFGKVPDSRMVAKRIANNRRFIAAAPAYLARAGVPATPEDLARHACLVVRSNELAYGTWQLARHGKVKHVRVHGAASTNDGETALGWALDGRGVVLATEWNTAEHIASGALKLLLKEWSPAPADVYVVYVRQQNLSRRIKVFADFLQQWFADRPPVH
ncbi:MAG: LysR family transcriptional regulator [Rubrivivax sp.]|nr:LysR family transcriptional regulator [Rubrivivax sp.]